MASEPKKPSPLTRIEKEGDAARAALARELAQKASENPSLISAAQLNRLGTSGVRILLSELRKVLHGSARPAHQGETSTARPPSSNQAAEQNTASSKQGALVTKSNPGSGSKPEPPRQTPRPPRNLTGWGHLRVRRWASLGGFAFGLLVGLMLLLIGVLVLAAPLLQSPVSSQ